MPEEKPAEPVPEADEARQARREKRQRRKREKMPQHGAGVKRVYRDAVEKRTPPSPNG